MPSSKKPLIAMTEEQIMRRLRLVGPEPEKAVQYALRAVADIKDKPAYFRRTDDNGNGRLTPRPEEAARFDSIELAGQSPGMTNTGVEMEIAPAPEPKRSALEEKPVPLDAWGLSSAIVRRAVELGTSAECPASEPMMELACSFHLDDATQKKLIAWALTRHEGLCRRILSNLLENPVLSRENRAQIIADNKHGGYDVGAISPDTLARYRGEVITIIINSPTLDPAVAVNLVKAKKDSQATPKRLLKRPDLPEATRAEIEKISGGRDTAKTTRTAKLERRKLLLATPSAKLTEDDRRFLFKDGTTPGKEHALSGDNDAIPQDIIDAAVKDYDDPIRKLAASKLPLSGQQFNTLAQDRVNTVKLAVLARTEVLATISMMK